jgi:hypothetical protein
MRSSSAAAFSSGRDSDGPRAITASSLSTSAAIAWSACRCSAVGACSGATAAGALSGSASGSAGRRGCDACSPGTLLDEVRKTFTVGGKRIPPEIFRDFGDGDLADSGSIWVTVDVHAAVGSNLYADPIKEDGRWVTQTKLVEKTINGQEQTSYQLIGATANNLLVLIATYNGGGSGTFYTLHILDVSGQRAFDMDGDVYQRSDNCWSQQ